MGDPEKFIKFAYYYFRGSSIREMQEMLPASTQKLNAFKNLAQETMKDINTHITVKLGGGAEGAAVEIDGTYLGGSESQKTGWGGVKRGALRSKKRAFIVIQERGSARKTHTDRTEQRHAPTNISTHTGVSSDLQVLTRTKKMPIGETC